MRLISWNVNGGYSGRMTAQVEQLKSLESDIIALQEVTARTAPVYRDCLKNEGYHSIIDSFQPVKYMTRLRSNSFGELIASRWPIISSPIRFDVPWPEKILSCFIIGPWGDILVHTAHIPSGGRDDIRKIETLEGIYKALAYAAQYPRILCGDFSTPQEELPDGRIITWGQKKKRTGEVVLQKFWGQRWDTGERNILEGLGKFDLVDVYRRLNSSRPEYSIYEKTDGRRIGRRYDHILSSESLNPVECRYLHYLREQKLSNHAAMLVEFRPRLAQTNPRQLTSMTVEESENDPSAHR
ncbi:MAG TPA: endonuclease/exonuclease/phosphatase family protein [Methanocella sp.]|nr:endonuclease/exonuclease/phosphatase family protein [Methanocella sp.]